VICLREKPISNRGTAMAGGGGDVESLLLGSDRAEGKRNYHYIRATGMNVAAKRIHLQPFLLLILITGL